MAQVTVFTAERMQEIEDTTVVDGLVDSRGNLLLRTRAGEDIDAGHVVGPAGQIESATATSLSPGEAPTVTLGGTPSVRTMEFGIPKGDKGDTGLQGDSSLAAGTISLWVGDTAPANWLLCNGAAVSRTTYASLFAAIGTKYGAGDGSTTFNVPNLKGRTPFGKDATQTEFDALAKTGGAKAHAHSVDGTAWAKMSWAAAGLISFFRSTTPAWNANVKSNSATAVPISSDATSNTLGVSLVGGTDSQSQLPPYQVVNFIIKATAGETSGDSELTTRVSTLEASISPEIFDTRNKIARIQQLLSGGGVRKVTSTGVSWSQRFISLGIGVDPNSPEGYFSITMPPDGTVIPCYNVITSGAVVVPTVTVAGGYIPMTYWCTLYYDPPLGQPNASNPSRFKLVGHGDQSNQFKVPSNWIPICTRNMDTLSAAVWWGDGRAQDYWHPLSLSGAWVAFGSGWRVPAYRFEENGDVALRGLVKNGALGTIAMLDTSLMPEGSSNAGELFIVAASGGTARLDVYPAGNIYLQSYQGGATNVYVSLSGVRWTPAD